MKQLARMALALLAAAGIFFGGQADATPISAMKIEGTTANAALAEKAACGYWGRRHCWRGHYGYYGYRYRYAQSGPWRRHGNYRCARFGHYDGSFELRCHPVRPRTRKYVCTKEFDGYGRWSMRCRPYRAGWEPAGPWTPYGPGRRYYRHDYGPYRPY